MSGATNSNIEGITILYPLPQSYHVYGNVYAGAYVKDNQATSYKNATCDIIEEYLRPTPVEIINY